MAKKEDRPRMTEGASHGIRRYLLRSGMSKADDLLARTDLLLPDRRKIEGVRKALETLHDQEIQDWHLFLKSQEDILWMVKEHQRYLNLPTEPTFNVSEVVQKKIRDVLLEYREREKGLLKKKPNREALLFVAERLGLRAELGIGVLDEDQQEYIRFFWPKLSFL